VRFIDPALLNEPEVPATIRVRRRGRSWSCFFPSPRGSGAHDPTTGRPAPGGHPGQAAPHGTTAILHWFAVTRCPPRSGGRM